MNQARKDYKKTKIHEDKVMKDFREGILDKRESRIEVQKQKALDSGRKNLEVDFRIRQIISEITITYVTKS
jgi:hypothetical protein